MLSFYLKHIWLIACALSCLWFKQANAFFGLSERLTSRLPSAISGGISSAHFEAAAQSIEHFSCLHLGLSKALSLLELPTSSTVGETPILNENSVLRLAHTLQKCIEANRMVWRTFDGNDTGIFILAGTDCGQQLLPFDIQLIRHNERAELDRIIIHLGQILIENQKTGERALLQFKPFSFGTYKELTFALDYPSGLMRARTRMKMASIQEVGQSGEQTVYRRNLFQEVMQMVSNEMIFQRLAFSAASGSAKRREPILARYAAPLTTYRGDPSQAKSCTIDQLVLIQDFAEHGDLEQFLKTWALSTQQKIQLSIQILEGLAQLHAQSIHHRDIKPTNVLVFRDPKTQEFMGVISDFGISIWNYDASASLQGTKEYLSPENLNVWSSYLVYKGTAAEGMLKAQFNNNLANDVWAMGLTLLYIFSPKILESYRHYFRVNVMKGFSLAARNNLRDRRNRDERPRESRMTAAQSPYRSVNQAASHPMDLDLEKEKRAISIIFKMLEVSQLRRLTAAAALDRFTELTR